MNIYSVYYDDTAQKIRNNGKRDRESLLSVMVLSLVNDSIANKVSISFNTLLKIEIKIG